MVGHITFQVSLFQALVSLCSYSLLILLFNLLSMKYNFTIIYGLPSIYHVNIPNFKSNKATQSLVYDDSYCENIGFASLDPSLME